jgi:hypothetical protein
MMSREVVCGIAVYLLTALAACSGKNKIIGSVTQGTAASDGSGSAAATGGGGAGGGGGAAAAFPLKLSTGARYLVDQNDRPFLMLGDSAWSLIAGLSTMDATVYLENRRQKGFNSVLVNLIEHKYAPSPPKNIDGAAPFTGTLVGTSYPDFSTPNEAYFAHVDQVLTIALQKGILVELAPAYLGYAGGAEGWYQEMKANGVDKLMAYGTYVGNRYKSFGNIIWVEGGDTDPTVSGIDPAYTRAVATAIKAADPNHLHTVHCNVGDPPLDVWSTEPWLSIDNVYTYPAALNMRVVYGAAQTEYGRSAWKPFFLIESTYEGENSSTPRLIRQQGYEALLNGGMGENFGNRPIWLFDPGWQSALDGQGSNDMTRLHALFSSRRWNGLVPDTTHTFLTGGNGTGATYVSAALGGDGKLALVYAPTAAAFTVALTKMSGQATARWYDPTSGSFMPVTGSPFPNTAAHTFTPPGANGAGDPDWVLVLEAS